MVEDEFKKFGSFVVQQSRTRLTKAKKNNTKSLYNSLKFDIKKSKNSVQFNLYAEDYATFIDKGVKGVSSSEKAPKSPYRFGTGTGKKGGLTEGTNKWVRSKRIQFRKENGRFMTYDQTAFLIMRSVWNKGLETTNFLTIPVEQGLKRLPEEILNAYGLEAERVLQAALDNI